MKINRWIAGLGAIAALGLIGLVSADASSLRMTIVSDDLSNSVRQDSGSAPAGKPGASYGGLETSERGVAGGNGDSSNDTKGSDTKGKDNNGHGNNIDGVDSSNKGQGKGGPNGGVDASCDGTGDCVDDEKK